MEYVDRIFKAGVFASIKHLSSVDNSHLVQNFDTNATTTNFIKVKLKINKL